jgi:hypothetical protein
MARSFDCVDLKLGEADFFLEKLRSCGVSIWEANFYFSAFVSAARSVTFALQAVMNDQPEFAVWYSSKQAEMRADPVCSFFVTYRNEVLKTGELPITGGFATHSPDKPAEVEITHHFSRSIVTGDKIPPKGRVEFIRSVMAGTDEVAGEPDVVTYCREYMSKVAGLVACCYRDFGPVIDPEEHYTLVNLRRINKSLEDVEEELGLPRGFTNIGSHDDEERLRVLRSQIPRSNIKHLFEKYGPE